MALLEKLRMLSDVERLRAFVGWNLVRLGVRIAGHVERPGEDPPLPDYDDVDEAVGDCRISDRGISMIAKPSSERSEEEPTEDQRPLSGSLRARAMQR